MPILLEIHNHETKLRQMRQERERRRAEKEQEKRERAARKRLDILKHQAQEDLSEDEKLLFQSLIQGGAERRAASLGNDAGTIRQIVDTRSALDNHDGKLLPLPVRRVLETRTRQQAEKQHLKIKKISDRAEAILHHQERVEKLLRLQRFDGGGHLEELLKICRGKARQDDRTWKVAAKASCVVDEKGSSMHLVGVRVGQQE